MTEPRLVCFDMAGTTLADGGLVLEAFARTIHDLDIEGDEAAKARDYVIETMGQSKIEVFTTLFGDMAYEANEMFEENFIEVAKELGVHEVSGARATIEALQQRGYHVALTTGFSPETREALIVELGWCDLVPVRVSPADAGRGRPEPDMLLLCAKEFDITDPAQLIAVGDTASDMIAGARARAGFAIGVLTGTDSEDRLLDSGADLVLSSVTELLDLDFLQ